MIYAHMGTIGRFLGSKPSEYWRRHWSGGDDGIDDRTKRHHTTTCSADDRTRWTSMIGDRPRTHNETFSSRPMLEQNVSLYDEYLVP
jgi:hypothetical protein